MAKIICVLYDDPIAAYPKSYARDDVAQPEHYPDGQTLPTPKGIDFKPAPYWAACPENWVCVNIWNQMAISWL